MLIRQEQSTLASLPADLHSTGGRPGTEFSIEFNGENSEASSLHEIHTPSFYAWRLNANVVSFGEGTCDYSDNLQCGGCGTLGAIGNDFNLSIEQNAALHARQHVIGRIDRE